MHASSLPLGASSPPPAPREAVAKARSILVIDDCRMFRRAIVSALKQQGLFGSYLEAVDGLDGLRVAASESIDLVLCDLDMPRLDGFGFLREFRAKAANRSIPVLMLSGTGTTAKKVQGFALGASDYIVKPWDAAELCARVVGYLRLKVLQDQLEERNRELEAKNAELAKIAVTDSLTGLYNRRHFLARAQEEILRSRRHGHGLGVILFDVDHFKRVNDTLGHQKGDEVLIAIARALRSGLRQTDLLARYGGEEFVACLPETGGSGAAEVAERVRAIVEDCPMPGMDQPVTVSIGVSAYPTAGIDGVDGLLRRADEALYRAKGQGRNRVTLAA